MKYQLNLLVSIDQFFNTLAGGNSDVTISGHVGIMAESNKKWWWVADMIDITFMPIEPDHCVQAFLSDDDEDTTDNLIATSIVATIGCLLLFIPIRLIALFDKIIKR